jgi:transposase
MDAMALGKRTPQQQEMWIATADLPRSPGHIFYRKLNELLSEVNFDHEVESLCKPYYAEHRGRPSIPPGVYFRMLLIGFFEGIGSQRGIAWRCSDSLSLREFLGLGPTDSVPDHSSLTRVRDRLPLEVHQQVFLLVLQLAGLKKLLKGTTIGVDATTLEANAAMKSIVRKDTGEDWDDYLKRLIKEEEDNDDPTDEDLRRFDKKRKGKKVSNEEWKSPSDPDSRITRMKSGRTKLAYKAEHAVDLDTELIMAAEIYHGDQGDTATLEDSVNQAQYHLIQLGHEAAIENVVADKGYHSAAVLATFNQSTPYRCYIPEPKQPRGRRWTDKPAEQQQAVYNNRRRSKRSRHKKLQRLRSERVERSFAHVCETGGARRTWLRGIDKVRKRYLMAAAARNLSVLMRAVFKMGTARGLQGNFALFGLALTTHLASLAGLRVDSVIRRLCHQLIAFGLAMFAEETNRSSRSEIVICSTGC